MKTTFAFLTVLFLNLSMFGQTDTVYYSSGCDNAPKGQYFNFFLNNNTFHASGSISGNCCGDNFLIYNISNDTIFMSKGHEGDVCYCICYYPFDFKINNCFLSAYHVIVYQTNIDTTIYAQLPFTTDINEAKKPLVTIYPNPAKEKITVNLTGIWTEAVTFEIYNIIGQKVFTKEGVSETFVVEKGKLPTGAYFYKLRTRSGNLFTGKILLE